MDSLKWFKDGVLIAALIVWGWTGWCASEWFVLQKSTAVQQMQTQVSEIQKQAQGQMQQAQNIIRQLQIQGDDKTRAIIAEILNPTPKKEEEKK